MMAHNDEGGTVCEWSACGSQVTFFAGCVAVGGWREAEGRNAYLLCGPPTRRVADCTKPRLQPLPSVASARFANSWICRICTRYSEILSLRWVKACVGAALVAYWALSVFGFSQMAVVMTAAKTVLPDSNLHYYLQNVEP